MSLLEINAASSGRVEDILSLEEWIFDIESVLDAALPNIDPHNVPSKFIIVGSSLGAWLGLLIALRRPSQIGGVVLLAPAIDASRRWAGYSRSSCGQYVEVPSNYISEGVIRLHVDFMKDANDKWLLLEEPGKLRLSALFKNELKECPVDVLAGEFDEIIPVAEVGKLAAVIDRENQAKINLVVMKGGDHRLSRPKDLDQLVEVLKRQVGVILKTNS